MTMLANRGPVSLEPVSPLPHSCMNFSVATVRVLRQHSWAPFSLAASEPLISALVTRD